MSQRGSAGLAGRLRGSGLRASLGRGGAARRRARASLRFSRRRAHAQQHTADGDNAHTQVEDIPRINAHKALLPCDVAAASSVFRAVVSQIDAEAAAQVPLLRQVPLGKRWAVDVVAVVQNALLAECADLLDIVTTMAMKTPKATELRTFFAWFSTFESLIVAALKAEEEVLYPWLEQWGRIDGALATGSRIAAKGAIIRCVRDCAASAALLGLHHLPAGGILTTAPDDDALAVGFASAVSASVAAGGGLVGAANTSQGDAVGRSGAESADPALCDAVLHTVIVHVSALVGALAIYLREQADALPVIIEQLYDAEDVRASAVDRRTVRAIARGARRDDVCVMLVRGLGDDRVLARAWAQRCLRHIDRIALPLWRRRYAAGRGAVVARFRARKLHLERQNAHARPAQIKHHLSYHHSDQAGHLRQPTRPKQ